MYPSADRVRPGRRSGNAPPGRRPPPGHRAPRRGGRRPPIHPGRASGARRLAASTFQIPASRIADLTSALSDRDESARIIPTSLSNSPAGRSRRFEAASARASRALTLTAGGNPGGESRLLKKVREVQSRSALTDHLDDRPWRASGTRPLLSNFTSGLSVTCGSSARARAPSEAEQRTSRMTICHHRLRQVGLTESTS